MTHHEADHGAHASRVVHEHRHSAPRVLRFGVLTVSDTRTEATDASGRLIAKLVTEAGHEVASRAFARDEVTDIRAAFEALLNDPVVDVVVSTGGTGVSRRDVTIETVQEILEKELPGFGELFRSLSFEEVGSAAFASRAMAGTALGRPVFVLPGSPAACMLAMERLVLPEAGHLVGVLRR